MLTNLGDLLDRNKDSSKLALIDCLDWAHPREYTHGEVDALADACARGLLKRGLVRGDSVAILSANRAEFLIAYFGTMRAGLVAVPVNHKFPRVTIDFVMRDSSVKLVLCDAERRPAVAADLPIVEFGPEFEALLDRGPFETVVPRQGEVAMVLYTSGSTGRPKGVPLSHQGHLWAVESRLKTIPPGDHRLIVAAPLFHMNGLGTSKFVFAAHASMVLMPQFDAKKYVEAVGRFGVTWLTSVPTMLAMMVREKDTIAKTDLSSVRTVRMGSAPTTQKLIDDLRSLFPKATIMNAYGTTEAGPVVFGPHPDGRPRPDMALGWPLPDVQARLIDSEGRDTDEGVLVQHTPATMTGYLNLPEKSREALTPDGWYISGDVFRRDAQGAYYFIGRADDTCSRSTRTSRSPVSSRCPTSSRARSPSHSSCAARALNSAKTRSSSTPSPMPRPTSIRARSNSWTCCRSPARTRSTANSSRRAPASSGATPKRPAPEWRRSTTSGPSSATSRPAQPAGRSSGSSSPH